MDEAQWLNKIADALIGRTITGVRYLSKHECEESGWGKRPIRIELDNGDILCPISDDEGNEGGAIATNIEGLSTIPVL